MDRKDSFRACFARLTLAALTVGASTCGGGGGRSVPFDDLAGDSTNAECDFLVACGAAPDRATCLASIGLNSTQLATMKTDIAAGIVVYDGQAAGACIDVFKSLVSCKQTAIGDTGQRLDATCGKVFTGTLPAGGACFFSDECANQGICGSQTCSGSCCAGTCVARPAPIPLGGDCSSPLQYQDCIEGTVCAADATGGGSCKVPLAAGARCGPYDRCVRPYQCGGISIPSPAKAHAPALPARDRPAICRAIATTAATTATGPRTCAPAGLPSATPARRRKACISTQPATERRASRCPDLAPAAIRPRPIHARSA